MKKQKALGLPKPITSKNPVVILKHVIKAIQEEPKRYDQGTFVELQQEWEATPGGTGPLDSDYFPACGTVCCVAGWVNILTNQPYEEYGGQDARAQYMLQLTDEEASELFAGMPPGVPRRRDVTPKTHANAGIKHIKRFVLKKWGKKI